MGYIKKLKNNELVGGTDKHTIYPVTSTKAVFEEVTEGNESSFKTQETINKEQQDELDDHEERIQVAEAEDIKSITINGSTKEFRVDDKNNVDLTIYTVDNDPEMPSIASNVEDLRNMVGTSTPVLETSHKTRIETLEGGESVTGSVENKIKTKVDSINSSYQDDNNEYVKYSMTQTSGEVTNFNIDETSLKNAITSLNTSISGDNIVIRSGSTPSGTGEAGKIYRYVNSSNNTYTDYMYSGGSWVTLATHDTSNEQAQVAYYTCTATGSGAQATKQFVGNGSLTYTPSSGGHIKILMGEANTATGTIYLKFDTTSATDSTKKPLYYNGEPVSASNSWEANEVISVYFDGTNYQASNAQGGGGKAEKIKYDNSQSGLAADNVQGAINELTQDVSNEVADLLTQADRTRSNGTISTNTTPNKWNVNQDYYGYWYKIDVFRGKKLTINTSLNGINTIAFTTVIETVNNSPMDYASGNIMEVIPSNTIKTYTIPSDANYIFVLTYGNGTDRTPQSLKVYEGVQDTLDSLGGLKKDITSEINISAGGFYRSSDGAWLESANWSSSDLIPTDDIESLYVSSAINNAALQVAFFDVVGKIMLSSSVIGNGDASVASPNIVKVPNGAKYAVVCGYTATSIPIIVSALYNKPSYIVDIEDSIEELSAESIIVPANNDGFYTTQNVWTSTDRWSSTNILCVDGYDYVRNTSVITNQVYSIVFFNAKGKVIGGVAGSSSTAGMETHETNIPSNAKYVVMSGFTANGDDVTSELIKSNAEADNPITEMKKITLVIIYGQSLSVGADSVPISTTPEYNNLLMLNTGLIARPQTSAITSFIPIVENSWETPASGTGEMFVEALQKENAFGSYQSEWNGHNLVFACPGVGGATIDELIATSYYQYVENILTAVKNICDAHEYSLDIPAWCWLQGEQDTKTSMSASDYKTKLLALQNKFCNSVETITGITDRPKCIIYQPSCQNLYDSTTEYNYAYDHMGVPTAFMELLRDNNEFIASSPTYIFDPSNSGGVWVHLNEQSYKLLGAYQGYALKRLIIDRERNQGVVPLNITVDGNTIKIKYNVPCPPLRFDTDYVNAAPNMGFNVIKSDNTELISSVSVFNDTVTIVCTSSPSGAKLRYGMNGTYHEFISGQYHYYSGAGRVIGARGNLRDDQGCYVYKNIQGYKYPMYNWAYTFEKILE